MSLLIALGVSISPGLLGLVVHRQVSAWLADSWPDASVRWQRGWFSSRVEAADGQAHVALDIRHSPLDLDGPLLAEGPLTLAEPATGIELRAALDWRFDFTVDARSDSVESRAPVSAAAGPSTLSFLRTRDGVVDLRVVADAITIARDPDAVLGLNDVALTVATNGQDPGELQLSLEVRRSDASTASLARIRIDGIDQERARAWREAMAGALAAPPGSVQASLAWVGVASAWEQLARAGLVLYLEPLTLDGQVALDGQWRPTARDLRVAGTGSLQTLEDWVVPIVALSTGEPIESLRREFELQVEALAEQPGIEIDGERFRVDWPGVPD